jgi:hypothetical protein
MRISRIFRKYSRVLLLVFMSLLLVVFLIGDVISRAKYSHAAQDFEIGEAFGKPVYLSQTHRAEADFELAGQLGLGTPPISDDPQKRNLAMYLLLEEARHAGVRVGRDQIIESFRNTPGASEVLSRIRQRTGYSLNAIYDSLARVRAVVVLANYQLRAAGGASLPELEHAYRERNQEARVLVSVIDCKPLLSHVPEPTEEELQIHFEEAKDRAAEPTEEDLKFGYRIPDRVQVEYLSVDPAQIQDSVHVSRKECENYYRENQHKYVRTLEDTSPFAIDEDRPQQVPMDYEEVEDRVREDCRKAKAIREAQALVNDIQQEALRPWVNAPLGQDGVRQPPDDALVPFTELQRKFSSEYPVIYKKTELVTEAELRREPGLGRAMVFVDRRPVRAPTLAFRIQGLTTFDADDPTPVLRLNEPSPVLLETRRTDRAADPEPYQAYVFRVIRVEPSGPPASLDDVRERVVSDVKRSKAFEWAAEKAHALAEHARQVGLKQAVAEAEDLKALLSDAEESSTTQPATAPTTDRYLRMLEPFEPEQFFRKPRRPIDGVGLAPNLHERVFALADEGGSDAAEPHRVVAVPLARAFRWVVAELLEVKPIYRGDFEMKREELEQETIRTQLQMFYEKWFSSENILSRTGYIPANEPEP